VSTPGDAHALGTDVGDWLFDHLCGEWDFRFGGERWELLGDGALQALGYEADENGCVRDVLVLRRERDGACFEIALEAFAQPVPAREVLAARAAAAAQSRQITAGWEAAS
jgi:hypothetical protein